MACCALVGFVLCLPALLDWFNVCHYTRSDEAELDLRNIDAALRLYQNRTGRLPEETEGLRAVAAAGILEKLPVDPWGREYVYRFDGGTAEVLTLGRDGAPGGEGSDVDVAHAHAVTRKLRGSIPP